MVFFVSGVGAAFADQQVNNNTPAMLEKAFQELKQADKDLTDVYEQILEKHKDDMAFVEKFTKAQAAWAAFRNAELEAIFPAQDKKAYGSTYPLAYAQEKSRLILERAKQLNQWLTGLPAGTISAGSRGFSKK
jgi:uncharacterized protein YecT (DUF1311 family)